MLSLELRLLSLRDQILKWPDGTSDITQDDCPDDLYYKRIERELEQVMTEIAACTLEEQVPLRIILDQFHEDLKTRCDNTRQQLDAMTQKLDHSAQYIKAVKAYSQH